ncbi:hypothetical protein BHM03_00051906 [Ensete ventricosum]|nr:hypothetical protein BHM03_00051906 [Ensete ventricosum]
MEEWNLAFQNLLPNLPVPVRVSSFNVGAGYDQCAKGKVAARNKSRIICRRIACENVFSSQQLRKQLKQNQLRGNLCFIFFFGVRKERELTALAQVLFSYRVMQGGVMFAQFQTHPLEEDLKLFQRRYTLLAAKLLTHAAKQQRCAASAAPLFGLHLYGKRG